MRRFQMITTSIRPKLVHVIKTGQMIVLIAVFGALTATTLVSHNANLPKMQQALLADPLNLNAQAQLALHYHQSTNTQQLANQLQLIDWIAGQQTKSAAPGKSRANVLGVDADEQLTLLYQALDTHAAEISFWQKLAQQHKTYRDAHLQLTQLYLKNGDMAQARKAWQAAKRIDPNHRVVALFAEIFRD